MKFHWAPWRMSFILEKNEEGCIFCKLPQEKNDKKNLILYRGKSCFIILNKYPYNNGHLMVVPYRHTNDLSQLNKNEYSEMMHLASISVQAFQTSLRSQGHNLGMNLGEAAGAGIKDHLHLHIVPRWAGDTNFMPILADTKVLVEHLSKTYQRLHPCIHSLLEAKMKNGKVKNTQKPSRGGHT